MTHGTIACADVRVDGPPQYLDAWQEHHSCASGSRR